MLVEKEHSLGWRCFSSPFISRRRCGEEKKTEPNIKKLVSSKKEKKNKAQTMRLWLAGQRTHPPIVI
jgi:hypothetical protein